MGNGSFDSKGSWWWCKGDVEVSFEGWSFFLSSVLIETVWRRIWPPRWTPWNLWISNWWLDLSFSLGKGGVSNLRVTLVFIGPGTRSKFSYPEFYLASNKSQVSFLVAVPVKVFFISQKSFEYQTEKSCLQCLIFSVFSWHHCTAVGWPRRRWPARSSFPRRIAVMGGRRFFSYTTQPWRRTWATTISGSGRPWTTYWSWYGPVISSPRPTAIQWSVPLRKRREKRGMDRRWRSSRKRPRNDHQP